MKKNRNNIEIKTICGTTIDGILLNNGIASFPTYGGLLEIEDYSPTRFIELMSYLLLEELEELDVPQY